MTRIQNADEFLLRFREIKANYDVVFSRQIAKIRAAYADTPGRVPPPGVDASLEAHVRAYVVNGLLAALNWRLDAEPEDGLPNLFPEAPVAGGEGRRRFLDYLGVENADGRPLLIVETKRPNSPLPRMVTAPHPGEELSYAEVLVRGLGGAKLSGDWGQWLADLRDYVRSVALRGGAVPKRVVVTNGDWIVVFRNPQSAFVDDGECRATDLLVLTSRDETEKNSVTLYLELEHQHILGETPDLGIGELPFHIDGAQVKCVAHGLRLRYVERPDLYGRVGPVIFLAPLVFIRSRWGAWIRVGSQPLQYELPHRSDELNGHITEVQRSAGRLIEDVARALGIAGGALALTEHYADEESFRTNRGVAERAADQFILFLGQDRHFLKIEASVPNCPFHDWIYARARAVEWGSANLARSTRPRSFFMSGEIHHCAHRAVADTKASPIGPMNRGRCGPRSGDDGQAFCEIFRFEVNLCCRTCAFEQVCSKAAVFHLPCRTGVEPEAAPQTTRAT